MIGDTAPETAGAIETVVDAVCILEYAGIKGDADGEFGGGYPDGFKILNGVIGRLDLLGRRIKRSMMSGDGVIAADEVIGHKVDPVGVFYHLWQVKPT